MSLTLADSGTTLTLNPDLYWSDENTWHPVQQTADRTITGAHVVQAALMVKGRPITLEPQDDSAAVSALVCVMAPGRAAMATGLMAAAATAEAAPEKN